MENLGSHHLLFCHGQRILLVLSYSMLEAGINASPAVDTVERVVLYAFSLGIDYYGLAGTNAAAVVTQITLMRIK